jgi:XTP/dITP diphosphohydrolase
MTRKIGPGPLLVATHNEGKRDEIAALLRPFGVTVVAPGAFSLSAPPETEATFSGNALLKARAAAAATGLVALADDSGLSVDALDGAPGVLTADWAETPDGRDFAAAMRRVHEELGARGVSEPTPARFSCAIAVAWPDGAERVVEGAVEGVVVWPPRGELGHGYDPIFQPDGLGLTYGEIDRWEKNRTSHRGRAIARLIAECFT